MPSMPDIGRRTVITGHYGCGKTNLAVNLALDLAARGENVTVVDLDVVNPYFRSSDFRALLEEHGVAIVAPTFAGTTLDVPSLSPAVSTAVESDGFVIFDVGGDDVGATALGRFAAALRERGYDMLYVVNRYRNLTATPEEAAALLSEIEAVSHLKATGVVANSHLRDETTAQTVLGSLEYAMGTASLVGLPLRFTTVPAALAESLGQDGAYASRLENAYPVEVYVRTPWEDVPGVSEEVR